MEIARAWKDCVFREGLTEAQQALLPPHPAGASATNRHQGQERLMMSAPPTLEILTMGCCDGLTEGIGVCSWFCGSGAGDVTYGCCTPGRTF